MAKWQLTKANGQGVQEPTGAIFDDGSSAMPGEEAFSTDAVKAEAQRLWADGFNYTGPSEPAGEE